MLETVIPAAVRRQGAASDALQKKFIGGGEEPAAPAAPVAPAAVASVAPAAPVAAEPPAEPPAQPQIIDWEQRYKSMKGRRDHEVGQLTTRVQTLERELVGRAVSATPIPAAPASNVEVTEEERALWGDDLLRIIDERAAKIAEQRFAPIASQVQNIEKTVVVGAGDALLNALSAAVPNWQEINVDEQFLDWLALPDGFSGATRQQNLETAFNERNQAAVIAVFKGFISEGLQGPEEIQPAPVAAAAAPGTPRGTPAPVRPPQSSRIPLDHLAAPGRARSAAPAPPVEKPVYTRANIAQFYTARQSPTKLQALGIMSEAEAKATEVDIFAAQHEGRVV